MQGGQNIGHNIGLIGGFLFHLLMAIENNGPCCPENFGMGHNKEIGQTFLSHSVVENKKPQKLFSKLIQFADGKSDKMTNFNLISFKVLMTIR